jgi:hypothetical protein
MSESFTTLVGRSYLLHPSSAVPSFFRYCYLNFSPERHSKHHADLFDHKPKPNSTRIGADGEEMEIIHEYSWRNFFYAINFIRVVHQLTKRRPARISLLVQYKSSVSRFELYTVMFANACMSVCSKS